MPSAVAELARAVEALQADREPTRLADHGAACCRLARRWLECVDSSFQRGSARAAPPAWITQHWSDGATRRPIHWCDIAGAPGLDAGAVAALGRELWSRRCAGICAVQLVVRGPAHHAAIRAGDGLRDVGGALVHQEAVGRARDGRLDVWDCREGVWLRPPAAGHRAQTLSLRFAGAAAELRWGEHRLAAGAWSAVDRALAGAEPLAGP